MLGAAERLEDLKVPPGNRLEALKGDRSGQRSIRINRQWRICFRWNDGAEDVEIVDYHWPMRICEMPNRLELIPPGEILVEEFMRPLEISQARLARDPGVSAGRIGDTVHGRGSISADMALRLSTYFGTSAEFWLNLQSRHDLKLAPREVGEQIKRGVTRLVTAAE